jgi:hypothetical protein
VEGRDSEDCGEKVITQAERDHIRAGLEAIEAAWKDPGDYTDGVHWPCLFYDLDRFAVMLDSAAEAIWPTGGGIGPVPFTFLEVGSGIGTKAAYAMEAYGMLADGIERIPEYIAESRKLGIRTFEVDAMEFGGYQNYGIVYVNHPFRHRQQEEPLERKIQAEMLPGAVLIAVNSSYWPQWELLEPRDRLWPMHGAWRKPQARESISELPGMWETADLIGGQTDVVPPAATSPRRTAMG